MKPNQYRQGDVLLQEIESIPITAVRQERDNGRVILAYGEVTGHAHAVLEPTVTKLASGIAEYLDAPKGCTIGHEEHSAITVAPGQYQIIHQREYTPERIVPVRD